MFGTKRENEDAGLLRLQKEIARDKLRMSQHLVLRGQDRPVGETSRRPAVSRRLYQIFADMGEG